jgi:NAD(P)-dependent dehydrogenase (short-subunit alcohol dehydrogenase family)
MKKKLLILGGSSDIGVELAKKLSNFEEYEVIIHYNKNKKFFKKNSECKFLKSDLSKLNFKNTLKQFRNDYDIIINLVGYISNSSFQNFKPIDFQKTIYANTLIPLMIIRKSLQNMKKKRFGRIINTSSIGVKFGGGENTFLYSLSKFSNEFIPSYIKKLASNNILYNCVRIGVVDTKFHHKIKNKNLKERASFIPMKRVAKKEEIADLMVYLINNNKFINNEIINITGGE